MLIVGVLMHYPLVAQQATGYAFSTPAAAPGSYAGLVGGTVLAEGGTIDDAMWYGVPIGFDFPFGGGALGAGWYETLSVSSNGWLRLGGGSLVADEQGIYNAASSTTQPRVLMPFARNLEASDATSEVRYETLGASPNRVCVVQWKNFQQKATAPKMRANFQARLHETTGIVEFAYGDWTFASGFNGTAGSVGLKGDATAPVTDYRLCTSTSYSGGWATPTLNSSSAQNTHYVENISGKFPTNGLVYRFTPPSLPTTSLVVTTSASPRALFGAGTTLITASGRFVGGIGSGPLSASMDATAFGGAAAEPMVDDGSRGDLVAGDGVFSATLSVTPSTSAMTRSLIVTLTDGVRSATGTADVASSMLSNDFPEGALPITLGTNGPFTNVGALTDATPFRWNARVSAASANPGCTYAGSYGTHDVWFTWTAPCGGTLWASTFSNDEGAGTTLPSGFMNDSVLSVWTPNGVSLACGDDTGAEAPPIAGIGQSAGVGSVLYRQSVVALTVTGGTTYLLRVAASGTTSGTPGSFFLRTRLVSGTSTTLGLSCGATPAATFTATPPLLGATASIALANAEPLAYGMLFMSTPTPTITPWQGCSLYLNALDILLYLPFGTDGGGAWSYATPFRTTLRSNAPR
jgi:hypothetical protein